METWKLLREYSGMALTSPPGHIHRHQDLRRWCLEWLGKLKDKELAVGVMALYQLWLARNDAREEVQVSDPREIAKRSLFLVEEWAELQPSTTPKNPAAGRALAGPCGRVAQGEC
jgi:hypothetical protein